MDNQRIRLPAAMMPGREGKDVIEYLDSRLSDSVCEQILREAYRSFRFLHSPLATLVANHGVSALRNRLAEFFEPYLARPLIFEDPARAWGGMDLLTLDRVAYHEVLSFVYGTQDWSSGAISETVLLWRDKVVWNGLADLEELSAAYDLLTLPGLAAAVAPELRDPSENEESCPIPGRTLGFNKEGSTIVAGDVGTPEPAKQQATSTSMLAAAFGRRERVSQSPKLPFSGFLTGPDLSSPSSPISLRSVWITPAAGLSFPSDGLTSRDSRAGDVAPEEHAMVAYRHMDEFTLLFFIPSRDETLKRAKDMEFYHSLEAHIRSRLDRLLPLVRDEWKARRRGSAFIEENYRYIYLNGANFAVRSSFGGKSTKVTEDMVRTLLDLRPELSAGVSRQFTLRLASGKSEYWVVAKKQDARELFVVLPGTKGSTLVDVENEVMQLVASFFGDVFEP